MRNKWHKAKEKNKKCTNIQDFWTLIQDDEVGSLLRNPAGMNRFKIFFQEKDETDWVINLINSFSFKNLGLACRVLKIAFVEYPDKNDLFYLSLRERKDFMKFSTFVETVFQAHNYSTETFFKIKEDFNKWITSIHFKYQLANPNIPIDFIDNILIAAQENTSAKHLKVLTSYMLKSQRPLDFERMKSIISISKKLEDKKLCFLALKSPNISYDLITIPEFSDCLSPNNDQTYKQLYKLCLVMNDHQKMNMLTLFPKIKDYGLHYNNLSASIEILS